MSNQQPRGTHECPLCGFDKPHTHDHSTVKWFEEAKSNPAYDVVAQRRRCRSEAEYQWRVSERRREFFEDPVGVLRRTSFKVDEDLGYGDAGFMSGRDFAFSVMPWVIELLERGVQTKAST